MFSGSYREGHESLPRVLHLSIARVRAELPRRGEPQEFLVNIHEEGTGISWQQNVVIDRQTELALLTATAELDECARNWATALDESVDVALQLGSLIYDTFIGSSGTTFLGSVVPTAILLEVDETILNLPWELIGPTGRLFAQDAPFGRIVTTRTIPERGRDPLAEDSVVRFLVVANPTLDLGGTEAEVTALQELEGQHGDISIEVTVVSGRQATRSTLCELLLPGDFDVLHFSGHAMLDTAQPGVSEVQLADGPVTAGDILRLNWRKPPGFVFGSACESGRAVAGRRLLSADQQANGLAGAFLTAGVYAFAGFFWPVTDAGAALFTRTFYEQLFLRQNVGLAFLGARQRAVEALGEFGDLAGYGAVLFGDAASKHRRDLHTAA
jgi:hypothetical protein